jgi:hypothetical protein
MVPRFDVLPAEEQWLKLSWTCWFETVVAGLFGAAQAQPEQRALLVEGLAAGMGLFLRELEGGGSSQRLPSQAATRGGARTAQLDLLASAARAQGLALYSGAFSAVAPAPAGTAIVTAALVALLGRCGDSPLREAVRETFLLELQDTRG